MSRTFFGFVEEEVMMRGKVGCLMPGSWLFQFEERQGSKCSAVQRPRIEENLRLRRGLCLLSVAVCSV